MNLQRTIGIAFALLSAASPGLGAPNDAPAGAPSTSPYYDAVVADLRAQFLDVYKANLPEKLPRHDVTLDFLDAAILSMADAPNKRNISPLGLKGEKLGEEKKLDAMGRWLTGYFFHEHLIYNIASDLFRNSVDKIVTEKSPLPFHIMARLASVTGNAMTLSDAAEPAGRAWNLTVHLLRGSFEKGEFENVDERVAFFRINALIFESATMEYYDGLKEVVNEKVEDEWLKQMALGQIEHARAWKIRSRRRAHEVDADALEPFHRHINLASLHFQAAYAAAPDRPEAPAMLIHTSKMGLTPMGTGPRYWFDIAVRNQFDYLPAYREYIMAIVPRWDGSVEALDAFADECIATDRYDSRVPAMAVQAWREIWLELEHDPHDGRAHDHDREVNRTIWAQEGRYEKALKMFKEYERRGHPNQRQTRQSENLCIAWFVRDMETVEALYDALGADRDQDVLNSFGLSRMEIWQTLEDHYNKTPAEATE